MSKKLVKESYFGIKNPPARLVMLPKESHGYASKESIFHVLWEQDQWLEKYVKNKPKIKREKNELYEN